MNILSIRLRLMAVCIGALLALTNCKENDIKTLAELKDEQATAIKTLTSEKHIKVVELSRPTLPDPIDFSVYYKFPNGLYMRILDRGLTESSGYKATVDQTKIFVEFKGHAFNKEKKYFSKFDILGDPGYPPVQFLYTYVYQYGETHFTPIEQTSPIANMDDLMCQGLAYPMAILGNGARVSLIIPFELGPSSFYTQGTSMFIEEAQYTFANEQ